MSVILNVNTEKKIYDMSLGDKFILNTLRK